MNSQVQPIFIYDGDCKFCQYWVNKLKLFTRDSVTYFAYQNFDLQLLGLTEKDYQQHVVLFTGSSNAQSQKIDYKAYKAAEAIFKALTLRGDKLLATPYKLYSSSPFFAKLCEAIYKLVANNRKNLSACNIENNNFSIAHDFFISGLGLIFFLTFGSLFFQITGLFGAEGIVPNKVLDDLQLQILCGAGLLSSALAFLRFIPSINFVFLFFSYGWICKIGAPFMSFQWDILLLESCFLAILLTVFRRWAFAENTINLLLRFLLFKLMLCAGFVKLASKDPAWADLTALNYHYLTQPLPHLASYYMDKAPELLHKFSCALMFFIELVCPFFYFAGFNALGKQLRYWSGFSVIFLMLIVILTGNYGFFNYLVIVLCLPLFDNGFWSKLGLSMQEGTQNLTQKWLELSQSNRIALYSKYSLRVLLALLALSIIYVDVFLICHASPRIDNKKILVFSPGKLGAKVIDTLHRNKLVSTYGLFAVMTKERMEIVLEGSMDGENWREYEFHFKPGDPYIAPKFAAPYQPRLDWQMWFAALSPLERNPWFKDFTVRLLQGSKDVYALLKHDPFAQERSELIKRKEAYETETGRKVLNFRSGPRYIRALIYPYEFTTLEEQKATGNYWKRGTPQLYMPRASLR